MKLDKVNGNWLLNLVKTHGLEEAARLQNYDMSSLISVIEDIKYMQYHKQPFHEEFFLRIEKTDKHYQRNPRRSS